MFSSNLSVFLSCNRTLSHIVETDAISRSDSTIVFLRTFSFSTGQTKLLLSSYPSVLSFCSSYLTFRRSDFLLFESRLSELRPCGTTK